MDEAQKTYRIRGIALSCDIKRLDSHLAESLYSEDGEGKHIAIKSLATAATLDSQVATVEFDAEPVSLQKATDGQLTLPARKRKLGSTAQILDELTLDSHFLGLTPLHTARLSGRDVARIDIVAVSGLGSHAFGSFKERGRTYMWLRDALGLKIPTANVWIYGYDSTVHKGKSVQNIDDIARGLASSLREVMQSPVQSPPVPRRLILLGHSLGGLVIKQALIRLDTHSEAGPDILGALCGLLFFGVPSQGMSYRCLLAMAEGGPNEGLLRTLMPNSEVIRTQQEQFRKCTMLERCRIHCFYETRLSPTPEQNDQGKWGMDGPDEHLVTYESATCYSEGASSSPNSYPIDASHSNMVKFRRHDQDAETVFRILIDMIANTTYGEDKRQTEYKPRSKYFRGLSLADAPSLNDDLFCGRTEELEKMKTFFLDGQRSAGRQVLILGGMGGVGKTQVALRYAQEYQSSYSSVFWFNAASELSLMTSIRQLAHHILGSQDLNQLNDQELWTRISSWLSETENDAWLLIYDNYDDPDQYSIQKYWPVKVHGSIIITTRKPGGVHGYRVRVKPLDNIQDSLQILAARSKRPDTFEDAGARQLVQRLDGLPLALATAGAFLEESSFSFSKYLEHYEREWQSSPRLQQGLPDYQARTLYTTWNVSLTQIERAIPQVRNLLAFLAYFDHQDIWYKLIQIKGGDQKPVWFENLIGDEFLFERSMMSLARYCLVEALQSKQSWSLHVCIHDWIWYQLNPQIDPGLYRLAFQCVSQSYVWNTTVSSWVENKRLSLHLQRLFSGRLAYFLNQNPDIIGHNEYHNAGALFADQSKFNEAEQMYIRALQDSENALGPDHTSTLIIVNNLGNLYRDQGKLESAEQMLTRALQGYENALGPDHTSTLDTVNNLGNLYHDQGKLEPAKQMHTRALQGYENTLGPDHTSTLDAVNNLGILYRYQGKLELAEKMYTRALQGYENTLGPDHTSTLDAVNNLGILYRYQGKLESAEQMYTRALQGFENTLGPDHTSTLHTVNNLGILYLDQGKLESAEQMYTRALQGKEKALGPDHTLTLDIVNNLGILYRYQGKLESAEQMLTRALQGYENALGPDHTSTLHTVSNLGNLYHDQGKLEPAEQMYIRALQGYENTLGPDHTSTVRTADDLGCLYYKQGKLESAREMCIRSLQGYKKALGPDHASTQQARTDLDNIEVKIREAHSTD